MSTHNICFHGEIRKNIMWIHPLICSYVYIEESIFNFRYVRLYDVDIRKEKWLN